MAGEQGIVIHVDTEVGFADLMTPLGEVCRVDARQWAERPRPGEEVAFVRATAGAGARRGRFLLLSALPLAAAAALALFFYLPALNPVVATVAVDINPSLELGVTAKAVVERAEGMNADGRDLLRQVEVKGRRLDRAVAELAAAAGRGGKLPPGALVVATVVPMRQGAGVASLERLALQGARQGVLQGAGATLGAGAAATVVVTTATRENLKEAHAAGIPLGKYLALEAARQAEPRNRFVGDLPVGEILKKAGLRPEDAFQGLVERVAPPAPVVPKRNPSLLPPGAAPGVPAVPGLAPGAGTLVPGLQQPLAPSGQGSPGAWVPDAGGLPAAGAPSVPGVSQGGAAQPGQDSLPRLPNGTLPGLAPSLGGFPGAP